MFRCDTPIKGLRWADVLTSYHFIFLSDKLLLMDNEKVTEKWDIGFLFAN